MKFAYMPDTHGGPYDQPMPDRDRCAAFCEHLVNEAVAAEEAGFDGAFVPERHARTETMWPQTLMALLAMALRTERIKIGSYVVQPAYYNPAHFAEQVALIDQVSRGRLVLGVGSGYHPGYFAHFGEPFDQRLGRFLETLAFMERAWQGERFDWDGRYWQLKDVLINPQPYQPGGPPLWFGATGEKPIRRAARMAEAVGLMAFYTPMDELRGAVDLYRSACADEGREPRVVLLLDGYVGETHEQARDRFGPCWEDEVRYYIKWGMLPPTEEIPDIDHATYDRLEKYMILGDADTAAEAVCRFRDALEFGAEDWIIFRSRVPKGPSWEHTLESIQRFGEEVIPRVRATEAAVA
ncbi:MAG: class flavin-dependent oxidoreductase [Solirubrobacterales bacterium]|nr:class flavin-dependent oxidoreductase [Solirubrobacterales bacterium]